MFCFLCLVNSSFADPLEIDKIIVHDESRIKGKFLKIIAAALPEAKRQNLKIDEYEVYVIE